MGVRALQGRLAAGRGPADLEEVRSALLPLFGADSRVRTAYLFGSQAAGAAREDSDIDIGVWLHGRLPPDEVNESELAVAESVSRALGRDDIDVVVLNGAAAHLRYAAVRGGVCLYERTPGDAFRDRLRAFKEWVDLQPLRERQARRVLNRTREASR